MELTEEQKRYAQIASDEAENSRWGHLYSKGSEDCEIADAYLTKLNFSEAQKHNVLEALRTGVFKKNISAAIDSVIQSDTDQKNTHR